MNYMSKRREGGEGGDIELKIILVPKIIQKRSPMSKLFNQQFYHSKEVILCIIIAAVHQFIVR